MTPSISISQIKYVLALEKTGSFSEAAEICFVTQSTLSTMIKKLEVQIDLTLFDRKTKPICLTPEGLSLIEQLRTIFHEYEGLKELVQKTKESFYGNLHIGIIPTIAPFLLPLFLDKILTRYPEVNFTINEITTNDIANKIKSREIDIGILSLPLNDKELIQKRLFTEDFLVYDVNHSSNSNKKYKINDIDVSRLWLLEEGHCMTNQIEKICHLRKKRKASKNLIYNSGSILSLLELVNMNKGITLLPRLASLRKNLIKEKFVFKMETPVPARDIGIITHQNFTKKRLLNILEKEIKTAVKPFLNTKKKLKVIKPF